MEIVRLSRSPRETRAVGEALAACLGPGDVVALSGDLGAGKTCLIQGIARALGVKEDVTSPTFLLMRQYEGTLPVVHVDVYRMNRLQELLDLGFDEMLDSSALVLIEWGDAVEGLLPPDYLEVVIRVEPDEARRIAMRPRGAWAERDGRLRAATKAWAEQGG